MQVVSRSCAAFLPFIFRRHRQRQESHPTADQSHGSLTPSRSQPTHGSPLPSLQHVSCSDFSHAALPKASGKKIVPHTGCGNGGPLTFWGILLAVVGPLAFVTYAMQLIRLCTGSQVVWGDGGRDITQDIVRGHGPCASRGDSSTTVN